MKKLFAIIYLILIAIAATSQKSKKVSFQFWDSAGKEVKKEKDALFFSMRQQINDTCWQIENYAMMGPLVSSEQFRDKEAKMPHGRSAFMRADGSLDSTGTFANGKPHGIWLYFNTSGQLVEEKQYAMGDLMSAVSTEGSRSNSDVEARFEGGANGWLRYLMQNLRYPQYALNNKIQGDVKVGFIVDEKGRVRSEMILKSVEFSLDYEALRLIKESPKWVPAIRNGANVTSYVQQGILFRNHTP